MKAITKQCIKLKEDSFFLFWTKWFKIGNKKITYASSSKGDVLMFIKKRLNNDRTSYPEIHNKIS